MWAEFCCSLESNLSEQMIFHLLAKCTHDNFFCHEILSDLNICQQYCIRTKFKHTILLWQLVHSFFVLLQCFFLRRINSRRCGFFHHTCGQKRWVRLSHQNRSPCANMTGFTFFTKKSETAPQILDWLTEIIVPQTVSTLIIFHHVCFWVFLSTMDLWIGRLGFCFRRILTSSGLKLGPILFVTCCYEWNTTFFFDPGPRNDHLPDESFLPWMESFTLTSHSFSLFWNLHEMSLNIDMEIIRLWIRLTLRSFSTRTLGFFAALQCGESWEIFHSNSIDSPSIVSKAPYCDELLIRVNLSSQTVFDCGFSFIFPRHNTKSEKHVNLRVRETDDFLITNQWQMFLWKIIAVYCIHSMDPIWFSDYRLFSNVKHLFHCETWIFLRSFRHHFRTMGWTEMANA